MTQLYYARFSRPLINGVRRWVCEVSGTTGRDFNKHPPLFFDSLVGRKILRINVSKPVPLGFSKRPHKYM